MVIKMYTVTSNCRVYRSLLFISYSTLRDYLRATLLSVAVRGMGVIVGLIDWSIGRSFPLTRWCRRSDGLSKLLSSGDIVVC